MCGAEIFQRTLTASWIIWSKGNKMGYITKEQALAALGLEPEVWCENDPAEIQERNDWYYYRDALEAVPELDVSPVIEAQWELSSAGPHGPLG